jgi:hypothetical protein
MAEKEITKLTDEEKNLRDKVNLILGENKNCTISLLLQKIYETFQQNYELLEKKKKTKFLNYLNTLVKLNFPSIKNLKL